MENNKRIARGYVQELMLADLMNGHEITLKDYMATTRYYSGYVESFLALFQRMDDAGHPVELTMGKHGGFWTATAALKEGGEAYV